MRLDEFTIAYIECALWASTDQSDESGGRPLDERYSAADFELGSLGSIVADCENFQAEHWEDIAGDLRRAGHDLWLTRNGHGAGFWDGGWPAEIGRRLTDAAHACGPSDLYIGDDGQIHAC